MASKNARDASRACDADARVHRVDRLRGLVDRPLEVRTRSAPPAERAREGVDQLRRACAARLEIDEPELRSLLGAAPESDAHLLALAAELVDCSVPRGHVW